MILSSQTLTTEQALRHERLARSWQSPLGWSLRRLTALRSRRSAGAPAEASSPTACHVSGEDFTTTA